MTAEPPVAAPSLLYSVKRLELAIRARLDEMLAGSGVTALQYTALTVLERSGAVSAAQLARASFVTPQAMADLLRPLEQRGLVRRSPNPASRRELLVELTDSGRALLDGYASSAAAIEQRMVGSLSAADVRDFRASLVQAWNALR